MRQHADPLDEAGVSAAFKSKALVRWEPEIVRPICDALIDEFIDAGRADLVRDFTFEFPTRVIAKLLGLPAEDLPAFRERAVQTPHISLAAGEHTCLGLHLTRMEIRVAVECLLSRVSNMKLVTDDDPHIYGQPFRSPTALPVTFDTG